jgi:hypothetical protein
MRTLGAGSCAGPAKIKGLCPADLAITMHVVAKWATLPDPPLDLCIEAAAVCDSLLSSAEPLYQDIGLQMVGCIFQRWGAFIRDALDTQFARQVRPCSIRIAVLQNDGRPSASKE